MLLRSTAGIVLLLLLAPACESNPGLLHFGLHELILEVGTSNLDPGFELSLDGVEPTSAEAASCPVRAGGFLVQSAARTRDGSVQRRGGWGGLVVCTPFVHPKRGEGELHVGLGWNQAGAGNGLEAPEIHAPWGSPGDGLEEGLAAPGAVRVAFIDADGALLLHEATFPPRQAGPVVGAIDGALSVYEDARDPSVQCEDDPACEPEVPFFLAWAADDRQGFQEL